MSTSSRAFQDAYDTYKKEEEAKKIVTPLTPRPVTITPSLLPPSLAGQQYTAPIGPMPGTGAPMPSLTTTPLPINPLQAATQRYNQNVPGPVVNPPALNSTEIAAGTNYNPLGPFPGPNDQKYIDDYNARNSTLAVDQGAGLTPTPTGGGTKPQPAPGPDPGTGGDPNAAGPDDMNPDRGSTNVSVDGNNPNSIVEFGQSIFQEYNSIIQGASETGRQALAALSSEFFNALDAAEKRILDMFKNQMGGVDEATMMALNQLRDSAKEHRKTMMEDMARRGILQSGIAIEMDLRLDKNRMTAEQQLLADRVRDLQNRMTDALMQFGAQRLDAIMKFGMTGIELGERSTDRQLSSLQAAMNQAMGITQFNEGIRQSDRAFDEGVRQFNASLEARAQEAAAQKGLQWAQLSEQQKANEIRQAELTAQKEQAGQAQTEEQARQQATNDALIMLYSTYKDRETAWENLTRTEVLEEFRRRGVDINKLFAEINKLPSKTTGLRENLDSLR